MIDPLTITNPKIAALKPCWANFRGFSLLFDNPGPSFPSMGEGLCRLDCPVYATGALAMLTGLAMAVEEVRQQLPVEKYVFCPLPPFSYHVTVWDGLNESNMQQLSPATRKWLDDWFLGLPHSLLSENDLTRAAETSSLVTSADQHVSFEFKDLFNFDDTAVLARLQAADPDSEKQLDRIVKMRTELASIYARDFGIAPPADYLPHVTLGYFANKNRASAFSADMPAWSKVVQKHTARTTITFKRIGFYGFTDMVTFFKRLRKE